MTIPAWPLPMGLPLIRVIGITPPAVVLVNTSLASAISSGRILRRSKEIPSRSQISRTARRVIPSSTLWSGLATVPSLTMKKLKPGPSVRKPSAPARMASSHPWSYASKRACTRSARL